MGSGKVLVWVILATIAGPGLDFWIPGQILPVHLVKTLIMVLMVMVLRILFLVLLLLPVKEKRVCFLKPFFYLFCLLACELLEFNLVLFSVFVFWARWIQVYWINYVILVWIGLYLRLWQKILYFWFFVGVIVGVTRQERYWYVLTLLVIVFFERIIGMFHEFCIWSILNVGLRNG